ncbi:nitroreductase/FMN reductase [NAD(P)H] [Shimia isoporae]|uniref:Nitroreductase/FMN reductase [NAD(P)H] n=1 Tax=Shimia isoporae TaxID=647720 RepID=A0A4R1N211_9RHOB|nr:nitroreductase family protein [Shimia isoporae]TCL00319.1 nitroreductase/FMN reductase [NAD(P)H] [Shimia isoporae]
MTKVSLRDTLRNRFGPTGETAADQAGFSDIPKLLSNLSSRGSCRAFRDQPVPFETLKLLAAVALGAPTKSDLQQCDIIIVQDPERRARLNALIDGEGWAHRAPAFVVFCGNNRRQRLIHEWRALPFANDHLDAFFNASVDTGIVLSAYVLAAESTGLGCCPVSAVRNEPEEISNILELPDHVFPVAGLAIGWPQGDATPSVRLPLDVTVHRDCYDEQNLRGVVEAYDRDREAVQPYASRRNDAAHQDRPDAYGWSEDKARQYSLSERRGFGRFVRDKGFLLD